MAEGSTGLVIRPIREGEEQIVWNLVKVNLWTVLRWKLAARVLWSNTRFVTGFLVVIAILLCCGGLVLALAGVAISPLVSYWALYSMVAKEEDKTVMHKLKDIIGNYVEPDRNNLWVAVFMGRIIGCVAVEEESAKVATLRSMSVDASYRGLGVGKRLMSVLTSFCEEHAYEEIRLGTTEFQKAAQGLYEKVGFIKTGTFHVPLPLGKRMEVWLYCLALNKQS